MSEKFVEQDDIKQQNQTKFQVFNFLRSVDLFGIPIELIYKKKYKHTTRFGGIISLCITLLIALQVCNVLSEVFNKLQPQVIFEEQVVESPTRNDLTIDNFTFVFGILNSQSVPFIDESFYNVKGEFRIRQKDFTQKVLTNGVLIHPIITKVVELNLQPCNQEYFKSQMTKDYFLSLNYTNLYCLELPDNENTDQILFLQGQYDNDIFSFIRLTINRCDNSLLPQKCQSDEIIENKLLRSTLQVYYTNQVVEVTNYEKPFKSMGQTQFWDTNTELFQRIQLMYRTVHVIDEIGSFFNQFLTSSNLQFSSDRSFLNVKYLKTDLFDITIYLEKNKESQYMRYYLKFDKAASLIGGMFNILFVLGALITKPYSKIQLNHKLINSTFNFSFTFKKNQSLLHQTAEREDNISQLINNQASQSPNLQCLNKSNNTNNSQIKKNEKENKQNKNKKDIILKSQNKLINNSKNETNKVNENECSERDSVVQKNEDNNVCKKIDETKEVTFMQYIQYLMSSYLSPFSSEQTKMIEYSEEKLRLFTDIRYIINKLVEIDKLKMLLLDEQQLELFNFIQKPLVDQAIIDQSSIKQQQQQQIQQHQLQQEQQGQQNQQSQNVNSLYRKNNNHISLSAEQAFKNLFTRKSNNHKLSKIDQKLVQLVDVSLVSKLMNSTNININKSNLNTLQSNKSNSAINQSIINKSNFLQQQANVNQPKNNAQSNFNNILCDSIIHQTSHNQSDSHIYPQRINQSNSNIYKQNNNSNLFNSNLQLHPESVIAREVEGSQKYDCLYGIDGGNLNQTFDNIQDIDSQNKYPSSDQDRSSSKKIYTFILNQNPLISFQNKINNVNNSQLETISFLEIKKQNNGETFSSLYKQENNLDLELRNENQELYKKGQSPKSEQLKGNETPFF